MSSPSHFEFDAVIVGGTPAGIMAGITRRQIGAARGHPGAQRAYRRLAGQRAWAPPTSTTRGATGGLFLEFVTRIKRHYSETYGADSQQVIDCSDGYRFEPHVAEKILLKMIAEQGDKLEVRARRQFDFRAEATSAKTAPPLRQSRFLTATAATPKSTARRSLSTPHTKATWRPPPARPTCWGGKARRNTASPAPANSISAGAPRLTNSTPPGKPTTPSSPTTIACR